MRAKRIYIITVGHDSSGELRKGAKALYQRLLLGGHAPSVSLAHLSMYTGERFEAKYLFGAEDKDVMASESDVGIYIVGHHGREIKGVGDFTSVELANGLIAMGFKHIRKLCILACRIADEDNRKFMQNYEKNLKTIEFQSKPGGKPQIALKAQQNADLAQTNLQRTYLGELSKLLAVAGMTPKIAGWDSFVTICYGKNPIVKSPSTAQHMELKDDVNKGRKVVSPNAYGKQSQYYAATPKLTTTGVEEALELGKVHKVIIQWSGDAQTGVVMAVSAEEWSDKNRLTQ